MYSSKLGMVQDLNRGTWSEDVDFRFINEIVVIVVILSEE